MCDQQECHRWPLCCVKPRPRGPTVHRRWQKLGCTPPTINIHGTHPHPAHVQLANPRFLPGFHALHETMLVLQLSSLRGGPEPGAHQLCSECVSFLCIAVGWLLPTALVCRGYWRVAAGWAAQQQGSCNAGAHGGVRVSECAQPGSGEAASPSGPCRPNGRASSRGSCEKDALARPPAAEEAPCRPSAAGAAQLRGAWWPAVQRGVVWALSWLYSPEVPLSLRVTIWAGLVVLAWDANVAWSSHAVESP